MSYSHSAIVFLLIFVAFVVGIGIGRHHPRVMAVRRKRALPSSVAHQPMPWCARCGCWHYETAPHMWDV